jgi:hypothetical protein
MNYTFSIADDTLNGIVNPRRLHDEIISSQLDTQIGGVSTSGDVLTISFNVELSIPDEASLNSIVAAHTGAVSPRDPQQVEVTSQIAKPAFSSKVLAETGQKLFKRDTGVSYAITTGANTLEFTIPFTQMKVTGVEILNAEIGDYCDFEVYDTASGTISGYPNVKLNQFGYNIYLSEKFYKRECQYDADVITGMKIKIQYTSVSDKTVYVNYIIHEVV